MADSRLRRFVGGLGLGYIHTIVTVIVGLWLTPYLLRHLGSHDYGLWLLGAQVLVYLSLMDLGIVQLVPRDVAIAAGRANGDPSELQAIVGQTARLVLWQVPPVALIGTLIAVFLPVEWAPLRWPLVIVIVAFVVSFPLRMFNAVLQGLQDLAFLGKLQLAVCADFEGVGRALDLFPQVLPLPRFALATGAGNRFADEDAGLNALVLGADRSRHCGEQGKGEQYAHDVGDWPQDFPLSTISAAPAASPWRIEFISAIVSCRKRIFRFSISYSCVDRLCGSASRAFRLSAIASFMTSRFFCRTAAVAGLVVEACSIAFWKCFSVSASSVAMSTAWTGPPAAALPCAEGGVPGSVVAATGVAAAGAEAVDGAGV